MRCCAKQVPAVIGHPCRRSSAARNIRARCDGKAADVKAPDGLTDEQRAQMEKAMADPEVKQRLEAMQEAMKTPEVQEQMAEMQSAMANPALQERLEKLKGDPELQGMFEDIQKNGMGAMMKYWNDPQMLAKLGQKIGDVPQAPPQPPAEPEINDLLDAARYGDIEAAEDFIAVGKDVNMQDAEGRTPLHYAAAHNHTRVAKMLTDAGANTEVADAKDNTALHYATGYGRLDVVDILLQAGADVAALNHTGKTALELAQLNEQNPILQDSDIMAKLGA